MFDSFSRRLSTFLNKSVAYHELSIIAITDTWSNKIM